MSYRRETVTTEEVVETPTTETTPPAASPTSVNINAPQDAGTTVADTSETVTVDDGQTEVNVR